MCSSYANFSFYSSVAYYYKYIFAAGYKKTIKMLGDQLVLVISHSNSCDLSCPVKFPFEFGMRGDIASDLALDFKYKDFAVHITS